MSKLVDRLNKANVLYGRAEKCWADGELQTAFRLFLAAANAGFVPAFEIVGQFYDHGTGVKANEKAALHWHKRAYREGSSWYLQGLSTSASNIGCICRDNKKLARAIMWFQRAVKLGDGDANLQIAKIYLLHERDQQKAIKYLEKTIKAVYVTDGSIEEASRLLKQLRKTHR